MWSIQELVDWRALLLLVGANGSPVVLARILGNRYAAPIDASRPLRDGRPLFGPHKTWRGAVGGIGVAGLAGAFLETGFAVGALFGALALAGDLFSSFLKRRCGCPSGQSLPLVDQLPEALLPLVCLRTIMGFEISAVIGTALLFTVLDILTARFRA